MKKTTDAKFDRKKPDFTGVPGEFCKPDGLNLVFGKKLRGSPYDGLLLELAKRTGELLVFGDIKARASIYARAKKLQMALEYAESGGKLYVRFAGLLPDHPDFKSQRRDRIMAALPGTPIQVARAIGDGLTAQDVEIHLRQAQRDKLVTMDSHTGVWKAA